jgi:hypothetical protein
MITEGLQSILWSDPSEYVPVWEKKESMQVPVTPVPIPLYPPFPSVHGGWCSHVLDVWKILLYMYVISSILIVRWLPGLK